MRMLLLVLMAFWTIQASALDVDACLYSLPYDLEKYDDGRIAAENDRQRYVLSADTLVDNGRNVPLNRSQRQQLRQYHEALAQLMPELASLIRDSALLGIEAAAVVGATLTGDSGAVDEAADRMAAVAMEMHLRFDGRHIPADRSWDGEGFEREIGKIVLSAVGDTVRGTASMILDAVFNTERAQARAEFIEHIVEQRLETRADALEARAIRVCRQLRTLDALETQIDRFDLIRADNDGPAI